MISVRQASIGDLEVIKTFNKAIAFETEGKVITEDIITRGVSELLVNPSKGIYYLAESDGEVLGCLMVNFQWVDYEAVYITYIQSVYTRPEHRGKGVFKTLFNHAHQESRLKGVALRLYADKTNARALSVYRHLGMSDVPANFFEIDFAYLNK